MRGETDVNEGQDLEAERFVRQHRLVAGDDAGRFERGTAAGALRGRQADTFRQLGIGQPRVGLQ
jgi:hypothetical protein